MGSVALSGSPPNALSGYLKPKSPPVLFPFQHLPPFQFLQQQRFDFFRARLQAAGFFVVFEDFRVGKLGVQSGLCGFQRGDFVAFNEAKLIFASDWVMPLLLRKTVLKMSRMAMEKRK